MHELQAGVDVPFIIIPQPPLFLHPPKSSLGYPALGDNCKLVQLAAFGNFFPHMPAQRLLHVLRKRLAHIAAVSQHTPNPAHS